MLREALATATKIVDPNKAREVPLGKEPTKVASKVMDVLEVKVEAKIAAAPPGKPHWQCGGFTNHF